MAIRAHTLLSLAVQAAAATGHSFLVFEAYNSGSSRNWRTHFPSLTDEQLEQLSETDGNAAIEFETAAEAGEMFQTLAREATENYTSIIGGEITLVYRGGIEQTFEIDAREYPVLTDGAWTSEIAPNRI